MQRSTSIPAALGAEEAHQNRYYLIFVSARNWTFDKFHLTTRDAIWPRPRRRIGIIPTSILIRQQLVALRSVVVTVRSLPAHRSSGTASACWAWGQVPGPPRASLVAWVELIRDQFGKGHSAILSQRAPFGRPPRRTTERYGTHRHLLSASPPPHRHAVPSGQKNPLEAC